MEYAPSVRLAIKKKFIYRVCDSVHSRSFKIKIRTSTLSLSFSRIRRRWKWVKHWLTFLEFTGFNFCVGWKRESYRVTAVNHIHSWRLSSPATSSVRCDSVMCRRRLRRLHGWASSTAAEPLTSGRTPSETFDVPWSTMTTTAAVQLHVEIDRWRSSSSMPSLHCTFKSHGDRCGHDDGAWQSNSTAYQKFPNPAE